MQEKCKICNSIRWEFTLFNGETKHFCSLQCINTNKLVESFREDVQEFISEYGHTSKKELINFLYPKYSKKLINRLISESLRRNYFYKDKHGFIYQRGKNVILGCKTTHQAPN